MSQGDPRSRSGPSAAAADGALISRTRWRLVAWSGGLTLVILLALGLAVARAVDSSLSASSEAQLSARATLLVNAIRGTSQGQTRPGSGVPVPRGGDQGFSFGGPGSGTFAMVVMPDNAIMEDDDNSRRLTTSLPDLASVAVARASGLDVREATVDDVPVRILSQAAVRNGITYVVQVVGDRSAEERTLQVLYLVLGGGGLVALLLALVGGRIYAERALVPIRDSLARQRDFAADASHELRTPLAVMRTSVEHLLRNPAKRVGEVGTALTDLRDEVDRLSTMVGDLLLLARADSGAVEMTSSGVDLADLATTVLADLQAIAAGREVHLAVDALPGDVRGDADRLRQLVTILVDNAIKHSPSGGTVMVRVGPAKAGKRIALAVEDQGKGLREEDIPHLFERFWRSPDAPEGGSGLGLAIASWIVAAHQGRLSAANRPEGGARFEVELPVAES